MFKSAVGGEELEFWEGLKFLSRSDVLLSYSNDFTEGSVHGVVITNQVLGNHQVAKSMCVTIEINFGLQEVAKQKIHNYAYLRISVWPLPKVQN